MILHKHKWKIKLSILALTGIFTAAAMAVWFSWDMPLTSTINQYSVFRFLQEPQTGTRSQRIVYGFVPYWTLNDTRIEPELTHLAYFGLTIGADGSILTRDSEGNSDMGYARLSSERFLELANATQAQSGTVELVLKQFVADDIRAFLASPEAWERLLVNLDSALLAYPFTGVNLDIELSGSASPQLRDNMTSFTRRVREHLDERYANMSLSIDMYAGAASGPQLWDVPAIEPHVDHIVVMAYDFHRRTSPQAGPVAPLFGGRELWDSDINQHLQAFLEYVPSKKLLLGVPFYGYGWQTMSRDAQSHTFPDTGSTATIRRVNGIIARSEELKVQQHWNERALSPYISYELEELLYVIYYENPRSIAYKLDYVNQLDLGGIAIWALGYEGDDRDLWEVIGNKIR